MGSQSRSLTPSFSHLLGQEKARTLLGKALESGHLAHAYLFRGPDGVGKQLFARSLATAVNCRHRQGADASSRLAYLEGCGECPSCRKYSSGNHPDFLVISPEKGTIKIDRIRELTRALSYPPYESGTRVVLLEDIHTMRPEAANSLLKTLEEPPENNLLILTAAASKEVLITISSRCQVIPFFNLGQEETAEILMRERPEIDRETAVLLARLSEGCPGQALLLYRRELIAIRQEVVALLSDPEVDENRDVALLLKAAETMADLKEDLLPLLGLLRIWIRDLLMADSPGRREDALSAPGRNQPGNKRKSWSSPQLFDKLQAIDQAEKELGRNCNRTMVCEVLLFRLQH